MTLKFIMTLNTQIQVQALLMTYFYTSLTTTTLIPYSTYVFVYLQGRDGKTGIPGFQGNHGERVCINFQ